MSNIFTGDNPFDLARRWLDEAGKTEPNDPNAASLATVDGDGMPNVRVVLLKEIEQDGFVFYTNLTSPKAQEALNAGKAAFVLYWKSLGRQIRVRGITEQVEDALADAYFATRPPRSQAGAIASRQSQPLQDRDEFLHQVDDILAQNAPIPRPDHWSGIRIYPLEIEFWAAETNRLHDRFYWRRERLDLPWNVERLYP